jgi:predicted enzyme related to lactoylglutathione lyase
MSSALNWFEIPVTDLARARCFYGAILQAELGQERISEVDMAVLPYSDGGVGGALVHAERFTPSTHGIVVYLDAGGDIDAALARVKAAGGEVVGDKLAGEIGTIAYFADLEGNRIGLHSRQ